MGNGALILIPLFGVKELQRLKPRELKRILPGTNVRYKHRLQGFRNQGIYKEFQRDNFKERLFWGSFPRLNVVFVRPPLLVRKEAMVVAHRIQLMFSQPSIINSNQRSRVNASIRGRRTRKAPLIRGPTSIISRSENKDPVPLPPIPRPTQVHFQKGGKGSQVTFVDRYPVTIIRPQVRPCNRT